MLPEKIQTIALKLLELSNEGTINWKHESEDSMVTTEFNSNKFKIWYRWDVNIEFGVYRISIHDSKGNEGTFSATEEDERDYELLKRIFDVGQAEELEVDFDI